MSVGDDKLHAAKSPTKKAFEEKRPERLGLAGADVQPHDFPAAFRVRRHGDYSGDADHPAAFTLLEVGRVQPQIGPFPGQRPGKEGMDAFIDVLTQRKRSIRRVLSGRAGSGRSSGRDDQGAGIEMLGQEGLALGIGSCRRQVLEEVA